MLATNSQLIFALILPSLSLSDFFRLDSPRLFSNCFLLFRSSLFPPSSFPPQPKGSVNRVQVRSHSPRSSHEQLSPDGCCRICTPFYPHCGLPCCTEVQKARQRSPGRKGGQKGQRLGGGQPAPGKRQGRLQTPRHRGARWNAGWRLGLWGNLYNKMFSLQFDARWKSSRSLPTMPRKKCIMLASVI